MNVTGTLELVEYEAREHALSPAELDVLLDRPRDFTVLPTHRPGVYRLCADKVGVIELPDKQLRILPRFGVRSALFLISYAMSPDSWRVSDLPLDEDLTLTEALAIVLVRHVQAAVRRGVLHGYVPVEERQTVVRGRIRFADQLRYHYGRTLPVEVAYDDFTEDILENRLLKAAIRRLGTLRLRNPALRAQLLEIETMLHSVSDVRFEQNAVPMVSYTRLNSHYEGAVELARLVLRCCSVEFREGRASGSAFLIDMATVFEDFLVQSLREAVAGAAQLRQGKKGCWYALDEGRHLKLYPDISILLHGRCVLVGDAKYKQLDATPPPSDLYQLLAYTIATNVDTGFLIYATGGTSTFHTRHVPKTIRLLALDLTVSGPRILEQVALFARTLIGEAVLPSTAAIAGESVSG